MKLSKEKAQSQIYREAVSQLLEIKHGIIVILKQSENVIINGILMNVEAQQKSNDNVSLVQIIRGGTNDMTPTVGYANITYSPKVNLYEVASFLNLDEKHRQELIDLDAYIVTEKEIMLEI